ncbi:unnamed protein product [Staurois parvus]|uniref:Uncharacterized protein n=1 Tax=Staurois parvus TaxID=386267 RepID=A0ABN9H324_9NEOB|nr:unnamed protein product [Staurois parvus]
MSFRCSIRHIVSCEKITPVWLSTSLANYSCTSIVIFFNPSHLKMLLWKC